jgi:hypothetical protein
MRVEVRSKGGFGGRRGGWRRVEWELELEIEGEVENWRVIFRGQEF